MQFHKVKELMIDRLSNELSDKLHYHGVHHTLDVLKVCTERAVDLALTEVEKTLLCTAAVFHDCGFLNALQEHEKEGVAIASKILPDFGYTPDDIERIAGMIMATKIPQSPTSQLEKIICDADLDYLGRDDFYAIGGTLFQELNVLGIVKDEESWDELQVKFLTGHEYHTAFGIREREPQKQIYLEELIEKWSK